MIGLLSVVIPAHNEAHAIAGVVTAGLAAASAVCRDCELIVVDDGSSDQTAEIVRGLAARDSRIVLISHERNLGIAQTMRTGFAAARGEQLFYTDGDGQFDPTQLGDLLPHLGECDFVVGYRAPRADPWIRRLNGYLYNRAVGWALSLSVRDIDCAFKLIRTESLRRLQVRSDSAFFFAELLHQGLRRGMKIREVPVRHLPRHHGRGSGNHPRVVFRALRDFSLYVLRGNLTRPGG